MDKFVYRDKQSYWIDCTWDKKLTDYCDNGILKASYTLIFYKWRGDKSGGGFLQFYTRATVRSNELDLQETSFLEDYSIVGTNIHVRCGVKRTKLNKFTST